MNKEIGFNGEQAVLDYMLGNGYSLITRNFSIHNVGELDLVMRKNDEVVVIEVKSRLGTNIENWGAPELAVNSNKLRKMKNTTRYLISRFNLYDCDITFMVGSVVHDKSGKILDISVFEI